MSRYYFHLSAKRAADDLEGEEYPSREAAAAEAREVARDLVRNRSEDDVHEGTLRVTDEQGDEVTAIRLSEVSRL